MLDSHSISSLNDYREIPFSRLINFYFGFARRIGKQNKYTLLNMPANCPIKYTLPDKVSSRRHVLWDGLVTVHTAFGFTLIKVPPALYFPENNDKIDL